MIFGVDIASWQGRPNFLMLKSAGHSFSITKATGEGRYVNPYWAENTIAAREAGLVTGYYDWVEPQLMASEADGSAAAADFVRVITPLIRPGDLICVDFETPDWHTGPLGTNIEEAMKAYMYALRDSLATPVVMYTGEYFLKETGANGWDWLGRDFHLWNAAPGPGMMADDSFWPYTPAPFSRTVLHQHQWYAVSDAVTGNYDRDRFDGDEVALLAFGVPNHHLTRDEKTPIANTISEALVVPGGDVKEPADGKYTAYINDAGEAIFVWNAGGVATQIDGIAVVDLGLSVVNEKGEKYDRSIQGNTVQLWHDRHGNQG